MKETPSKAAIGAYIILGQVCAQGAGLWWWASDVDANGSLDDDTYLTTNQDSFTITFTFDRIVQNYRRTDGPAFACGDYSLSGQGAIEGWGMPGSSECEVAGNLFTVTPPSGGSGAIGAIDDAADDYTVYTGAYLSCIRCAVDHGIRQHFVYTALYLAALSRVPELQLALERPCHWPCTSCLHAVCCPCRLSPFAHLGAKPAAGCPSIAPSARLSSTLSRARVLQAVSSQNRTSTLGTRRCTFPWSHLQSGCIVPTSSTSSPLQVRLWLVRWS